jgi:hypothetical protein
MKQQRTRLFLEELEDRLALSAMSAAPATEMITNWSGYAATSPTQPLYGSVTAVAGAWTVPTVTGPSTGSTYSSVWVGIGGFSRPTVEQIGTEEDVINGKPQYYAWFEMSPRGIVVIPNMKVHPGDAMAGSVNFLGFGFYYLQLKDYTDGQSYSTFQWEPFALRSSAEWIVEAPSSGKGELPLANFGAETFTAAYATINGVTGPIDGPWNFTALNMTSKSSSAVQASTSGLTDSHGGSHPTSSFTVSYVPPTAPTIAASAVTGISGHQQGPAHEIGLEFF